MTRPTAAPAPFKLAGIALLAIALQAPAQTAAPRTIVINEIARRDFGDRAVELYNYGPSQTLTGWVLNWHIDAGVSTTTRTFTFPAFTLPRHAYVLIHWGSGANDADDLYTGLATGATTVDGELVLMTAGGVGVDYLRYGAPTPTNQPADLHWRSTPSWPTDTCPLWRNKDLNTRGSSDWTNSCTGAPTDHAPNAGQVGTRRHGRLVINEFNADATPWVEIRNPHNFTVFTTGGVLEVYSGGTLPCSSTALATSYAAGAIVSFDIAGCTLYSGGVLDGEIRIVDAMDEGWDYLAFNNPATRHLPIGSAWTGGDLAMSALTNAHRYGDADSDNSRDFVIFATDTRNGINASQQTPRFYDELGADTSALPTGAAAGRGHLVDIDESFMLREYKARLTLPATQDVRLVIKQRTATGPDAWNMVSNTLLSAQPAANGVYSTGVIAVPIHAGYRYAFMLYSSGDFTYHYASPIREAFRYGSFVSFATDSTYPPTAAGAPTMSGATRAIAQFLLSSPGPAVQPAALATGSVGIAYTQNFTTTTGTAPITWALGGDAVPGMTLNPATGQFTGTPTTAGTYSITVTATDADGLADSVSYYLVITPAVSIATSALPPYDERYAPYSFDLTAQGGIGPYGWVCTGLPAGLTASAAGVISGTSTATNGTYSVSCTVTDANNVTANRTLSLVVYRTPAIITTSPLPVGYLNTNYGVVRLVSAGGAGGGAWTLNSGTLPPGLTVGNDSIGGYITGTPTAVGTYATPVIRYTDAQGAVQRTYSITIAAAPGVPDVWIRRGLAGGRIDRIFYSPNFALDNTIAAIAGGALYLSSDRGSFWREMTLRGEPGVDPTTGQYQPDLFYNVAFAPGFDGRPGGAIHTLAVSASISGVWVSDDLDQSWTKRNFTCAGDLHWDPAASGTGFCLAYDGATGGNQVYRGTANLTSWAKRGPSPVFNLLFMSPTFATDRTLFASEGDTDDIHILHRSGDAGLTWTQVQDFGNKPPRGNLEISPNYSSDRALMVVQTDFGAPTGRSLRVSTDGGLTFATRASAVHIQQAKFHPAYHASTNPRILAAQSNYTDGGGAAGMLIALSTNNGFSFAPTGTGALPMDELNGWFTPAPDFATKPLLLAHGFGRYGMFRSEDAGATWAVSDGGLYNQTIAAVAYAPNYAANAGRSFVATRYGIFYSDNGGRAWKASTLPSADEYIGALAVSPGFATDSTVFAASKTQLLKSTDGGASFTAFSALPDSVYDPSHLQLAANFQTSQTLFVGNTYNTGNFNLYKSVNGGATFTATMTGANGAGAFGLSPGYATDSSLYLNDQRLSVFRALASFNGGATFLQLTGVPAKDFPPAFTPTYNRAAAASGNNHTLFWNGAKSTDAGANFSPMPAVGAGFTRVSPAYDGDLTLFVAHPDYSGVTAPGLYKSTNGGTGFTPLAPAAAPSAFYDINHFALSPAYGTDATLMVGTETGLWKSVDGGANWTRSTGTEVFSSEVTAVAQDPSRAGRLYVGTAETGVAMSSDDGHTATEISDGTGASDLPRTGNLYLPIADLIAVADGVGGTVVLASTSQGVYRTTFNNAGAWSGLWTRTFTGIASDLMHDGTYVFFTRNAAGQCNRRSADLGLTWTTQCNMTFGSAISSAAEGGFPLSAPAQAKAGAGAPAMTTGSGAPLWSAMATSGARFSNDSGTTWTSAPGLNDYTLPVLAAPAAWSSVKAMDLNGGAREVLIGNNGDASIPASQRGVYLTLDGGDTWRRVSGPGSGLEATSLNASAFLTATTAFGTTDVLVGVNGAANGGVYLSGDDGEHWVQVNQGFDPNNLSISTLVKTACAGCPVQYYSGSYGGGMYTRTIAVNKPPFTDTAASWCTGVGCVCSNVAPFTGPVGGGTSIKLCGSNFQTGAIVEFDGAAAVGCTPSGGSSPNFTTLICTSPPHVAGAVNVRVRNPDTRAKTVPQQFTYTAGASRIVNSLRNSKSGANANLSWNCSAASCTAGNPARLYRAQSAAFSLYVEYFNGGAGGAMTGGCANAAGNNSCWMDATGIMTNNRSYFWVVE